MPLDAQEKSELVEAAGLAIDLDEPEGFIAALRRVALRKGENPRLSDQERVRWRLVATSMQGAIAELERDDRGAQSAQEGAQAGETGLDVPQA